MDVLGHQILSARIAPTLDMLLMWLETVSLPPVALQDFLQIQPREFVKLAHLIAVHAQDQIHLSGVRAAAAPYFFNQVLVFQHVHLATISSVQPQSVASVLSVQVVPVGPIKRHRAHRAAIECVQIVQFVPLHSTLKDAARQAMQFALR